MRVRPAKGSCTISTRAPAFSASFEVSVYIHEPMPRGNIDMPRIMSAFCQAARTSLSSSDWSPWEVRT
jgi:hypothetical protein